MKRRPPKKHYIYKITCNITNKWYIGIHSTYDLNDQYMGSGTKIKKSIEKYGVENHTKEILEFFLTRKALIIREIEIVNKSLIKDENCLNMKVGGLGWKGGKVYKGKSVKKFKK